MTATVAILNLILGVAYKLRRRVESHRLRIQDRGAEDVRVKRLEPAGGVDEQRKGRSMAFVKSVFAETFDLLEDLLRELERVTALLHAIEQLLLE